MQVDKGVCSEIKILNLLRTEHISMHLSEMKIDIVEIE